MIWVPRETGHCVATVAVMRERPFDNFMLVVPFLTRFVLLQSRFVHSDVRLVSQEESEGDDEQRQSPLEIGAIRLNFWLPRYIDNLLSHTDSDSSRHFVIQPHLLILCA